MEIVYKELSSAKKYLKRRNPSAKYWYMVRIEIYIGQEDNYIEGIIIPSEIEMDIDMMKEHVLTIIDRIINQIAKRGSIAVYSLIECSIVDAYKTN